MCFYKTPETAALMHAFQTQNDTRLVIFVVVFNFFLNLKNSLSALGTKIHLASFSVEAGTWQVMSEMSALSKLIV